MEARQLQLEETVSSLTDSLVDKQSTIDTLQLQVVIYREDFQSERADRERAQGQIAQLQDQLNQLVQRTSAAASQVNLHYNIHSLNTLRAVYPCIAHYYHGWSLITSETFDVIN